MEEKKKSGAEKAIDKAEARAREKMRAALAAWLPLRQAQNTLEARDGDEDEAVSSGEVLMHQLAVEATVEAAS